MKWAETMEHLVPRLEARECIQESYDETYMDALISGARSKMGLFEELDGDKELYESLLTAMLESGTNHFLRRFKRLNYGFCKIRAAVAQLKCAAKTCIKKGTYVMCSGADFTNTFRALSGVELSADGEVNDSTVEKTKEFILENCCYSAEDCQGTWFEILNSIFDRKKSLCKSFSKD